MASRQIKIQPQQANAPVGNSSWDYWYYTIIGTNQLWEDYLNKKRKIGSAHWIERHRYGGTGGMFHLSECLTSLRCAAFHIASITGMLIKDETDYENLWTYRLTPPKMKVTLSLPGDKMHEHDIVLEGFCHTFIKRPEKKKELERKYGKCIR